MVQVWELHLVVVTVCSQNLLGLNQIELLLLWFSITLLIRN